MFFSFLYSSFRFHSNVHCPAEVRIDVSPRNLLCDPLYWCVPESRPQDRLIRRSTTRGHYGDGDDDYGYDDVDYDDYEDEDSDDTKARGN